MRNWASHRCRGPSRRVLLVAVHMGAVSTCGVAAPERVATSGSHTNTQILRLPLHDQTAWRLSSYDRIPAHELEFSAAGLVMSVKRSAMPLIYALPGPLRIRSVKVRGQLSGQLAIPAGRQGQKDFDDFGLRIGLVEPGTTRLTSRQRQTALPWVRSLFDLAPPGRGIAKVHFLNLATEHAQVGQKRRHPRSEHFEEEVLAAPDPEGHFDFGRTYQPPLETCAVWIAVDGDDSSSTFKTTLTQLELEYVSP